MTQPIRDAVVRALARLVSKPRTPTPSERAGTPGPFGTGTGTGTGGPPCQRPVAAHESTDRPVVDSPSPLVRPYLLSWEQQERRTALELALDGIDTGPRVLHGHRVGTPAMGVAA